MLTTVIFNNWSLIDTKIKKKIKNIKIYREILTPFLKLATQMLQFVDLSVFRFRNCLWIYYLRTRTWFSLEVCTYWANPGQMLRDRTILKIPVDQGYSTKYILNNNIINIKFCSYLCFYHLIDCNMYKSVPLTVTLAITTPASVLSGLELVTTSFALALSNTFLF